LLNSADSMCRKFDLLKEFLQGILIDLVTDMLTFDFKVNIPIALAFIKS